MSVSGEGAALRSARKWLLLLCPEIPDRSGGKESLAIIVVKAAGYFGRSQRRHGMAYLRPSSIAAVGRSRLSAAVDRGSRPSAAAADRGIEISVATADPWIDSKNLRWHSPNFQVRQVKERATPPANFGPMSLDSNIDYRFCF